VSITSAQRTRLGIFIVVAFAITILVIAAGVGIKLSEKRSLYYSEFMGESLSGLTKGMEVKFRGIPIGKVSAINYDPKDLTRVKVSLEVEKNFPMKKDMVVQTGIVGITGLKYIEIMGGTNEAELLPEGSVIPSKNSLMAELTVRIESILGKVETLLSNLNTVTNPDSLKDVQVTLANVAELTGKINEGFDSYGPRLDSMTFMLNSTVANANKMAISANKMVNDLEQGNGPMASIIYNVDTTIVSVKNLTDNLNLTFTQSREDLGATMEDLKQTMENVNDLSSMLLENPSLLLRGSPQQKRTIK